MEVLIDKIFTRLIVKLMLPYKFITQYIETNRGQVVN